MTVLTTHVVYIVNRTSGKPIREHWIQAETAKIAQEVAARRLNSFESIRGSCEVSNRTTYNG